MVEYKPKYNPADNAEIERIAKDMPKPKLEDYYVKDRNRRYTTCGEGIFLFIFVCVMVLCIGAVGHLIGQLDTIDKVADNMQEISQEVCPYLGNGYTSSEALKSSYDETRIVCDQTNSRWGK